MKEVKELEFDKEFLKRLLMILLKIHQKR